MLLIVLIWDILSIISDISEKFIVLYPNNSHNNLLLFQRNNIDVYSSYQEKQELVLHPGFHTFLITKSLCYIMDPDSWKNKDLCYQYVLICV